MFRESLLVTSAGSITQRSCATLMSFALEMAGIAVLIIAPLLVQQAVPILAPPAVPRITSVTPDQIKRAVQLLTNTSNMGDDGRIHAPGEIPKGIFIPKGPERPRSIVVDDCGPDCVYVPNMFPTNGSDKNNLMNRLISSDTTTRSAVNPVLVQSKPILISHIDPGMLIARIEPRYPDLARRARIQGVVVITAVIGKDGRIVSLNAVSGHPMLVPAALDAVRQWRYRPYILNTQPVEVETRVEVNFTLQ